ncbi:hypothetical protein [Nocardia goodfellowii]|uniref:Uncharacterized protein n=1 Tax=Nocardia goodfellowii TaxID=882446 RepID=A0ABS4QI74_9NOCA|nr:hypothetical protein [Nocardia goodfellowii]MBP2191401.1 hypothetical protein [Nocardia goodfellowii]
MEAEVSAAAAGHEIDLDNSSLTTAFATVVMLLSGCPATVTDCTSVAPVHESDTGSGQNFSASRAVDISLYALEGDDLTLAQDLATTIVAAGGGTIRHRDVARIELPMDRSNHSGTWPS